MQDTHTFLSEIHCWLTYSTFVDVPFHIKERHVSAPGVSVPWPVCASALCVSAPCVSATYRGPSVPLHRAFAHHAFEHRTVDRLFLYTVRFRTMRFSTVPWTVCSSAPLHFRTMHFSKVPLTVCSSAPCVSAPCVSGSYRGPSVPLHCAFPHHPFQHRTVQKVIMNAYQQKNLPFLYHRSGSETVAVATPASRANTCSAMHPLGNPPRHPRPSILMPVVLLEPF